MTKRHERCSSLGLDVPIVTLTHGRLKKASIGSVLQTIVIAESECNVLEERSNPFGRDTCYHVATTEHFGVYSGGSISLGR